VVEHDDDTLARVVETLQEPVRIDPSFDRRVMAEVAQLPKPAAPPSVVRSLVGWLRRRRTIRLSPLGGLAMAAGVVALVVAGGRVIPSSPPEPVTESTQLVQFVLVASEASAVTLVGDFNDWSVSATPLTREGGDGVWWVTVPLPPGRYRYSFVVDGQVWLGDPNAPAVDDEFGRPNSVVTIGGA
jgi:hypothetical protein